MKTQFQVEDGGSMKAININWDTDGDMELLKDLPTEIEIPDGVEDSDYISDYTGFCHLGFELTD